MKSLLLFFAFGVLSCSLSRNATTFSTIERMYLVYDEEAIMIANKYLDSIIGDNSIRHRISYELMADPLCGYSIAYRVNNKLNSNHSNFIFVNLTTNKTVDLANTHISEDKISKHIHNPKEYPLDVSIEELIKIINSEKLKKGITNWSIGLRPINCDFSRLCWIVHSTVNYKNHKGTDKVLNVNVMNRDISYSIVYWAE